MSTTVALLVRWRQIFICSCITLLSSATIYIGICNLSYQLNPWLILLLRGFIMLDYPFRV
jgi:hypothetical protein